MWPGQGTGLGRASAVELYWSQAPPGKQDGLMTHLVTLEATRARKQDATVVLAEGVRLVSLPQH